MMDKGEVSPNRLLEKALGAFRVRGRQKEDTMSYRTNETDPRGTRANLQKPSAWKLWGPRLLKAVLWTVWVIDKALRLIAWLTGAPPS